MLMLKIKKKIGLKESLCQIWHLYPCCNNFSLLFIIDLLYLAAILEMAAIQGFFKVAPGLKLQVRSQGIMMPKIALLSTR